MTYGQTAYEGYCRKSGNKSLVSGAPLPTWDNLPKEIQEAWEASADAVIKHFLWMDGWVE